MKRLQGRVANILVIIRVLGTTGEDLIHKTKESRMKTSIQAMFDRFVTFQDAYSKCASFLEAQCLVRGYKLVNSSVKAEEIAVKVQRAPKARKIVKSVKRRGGRKNTTFPRFVGRLVVAVNTTTVDLTEQVRSVKAQSRAKTVAVQSYIKALSVAAKATAKVREVKSKTVGWSVDLLKAMSKDAQAKVALEAAKAAL